MATMGFCGLMKKPLFFRRKPFASDQAIRGLNLPKGKAASSGVQKKGRGTRSRKCTFVGDDQLILVMELVIKTLENLHTLYPEIIPSNEVSEIKHKINAEESLAYFCKALKFVGESWMMNNEYMVEFNFKFPSCNDNTNMLHLGETVLATLDTLIRMGSERLDMMQEEEEEEEEDDDDGKKELGLCGTSSFNSESNLCWSSPPHTPTSVLPETPPLPSSSSSSLLCSLRLQAVGKLNPIDLKRLSFHLPHQHLAFLPPAETNQPKNFTFMEEHDDKMELDQNDNSQNQQSPPPPPPPPPPSKKNEAAAVPPIPRGLAPPPPPPPPVPSKDGSVPPPPPPVVGRGNGGGPPPAPAGGTERFLRPKATTKLKRSTQLGNLYRTLKGKVEGSNSNTTKSSGRRSGIGKSTGGKQGMADALAEMTKRTSISNFKTKDMTELVNFHKDVESVLENLTDESQVLSRFEGFPTKKLEAIRMAAALYNKLNSIVTELQNWNAVLPFGQFMDKVERYFNKIKPEIDALERIKDEESKKFKTHNIEFDFHIIVKIKEAIVDVSSNCMELALKESSGEDNAVNGKGKMLWRAFQFAFRVYTFAGGHDDRADRLTRELAREIESKPIHT
ncbi:hypothetical protein G2W53_042612 [Senna tora]|uniref:Hydroxyproline-rich glycoprotein family protein n=1 Tax=Senna tora TaxID=362788 RepID=A0A834SHI1_9FABA|nr:hypothetical protein G2W53_042612 [Senna tora]